MNELAALIEFYEDLAERCERSISRTSDEESREDLTIRANEARFMAQSFRTELELLEEQGGY